jgi:hypothetical protein
MKNSKTVFIILLILFSINEVRAQFSKENSSEIIFSFSDVERNYSKLDTKMRFTLFFHAGQNFHYDFSNHLGVFTGYGIRNIGIVTNENDTVLKRRTYSLGVPVALKIGSFRNHWYFYTGSEYEMFFHYKQKEYTDDSKRKQSEWFSDRTRRFTPSFFAGIQFPGGINLKFKYYPENFLNTGFKGKDFGKPVDYSDFNKTRLFYFSLSFNFSNKSLQKLYNQDDEPKKLASIH